MTPEAEAQALLQAALLVGPLALADTFSLQRPRPGGPAPVQGVVISTGGSSPAVIGLASPTVAAEAPALKARAQCAPYLVAWNLRDAVLRHTPQKGIPALASEPFATPPCST